MRGRHLDDLHYPPTSIGAVMQLPWLAAIDLGGQGDQVTEALDDLRRQGAEVESVRQDAVREILRSGLPVLALAHTRTLTLETLDLLRLLGRDNVPTVVVSDHLSEEEELILLHSGAWVAFGLPVSGRLLQARLTTLFTHLALPGTIHSEVLAVDSLTINVRRREVTIDDRPMQLTRTEFDLLLTFALDPTAVISRQRLLHNVEGGPIGPRSLESHLSRLRLKITAAGGPRLIESVRGVGYRLRRP